MDQKVWSSDGADPRSGNPKPNQNTPFPIASVSKVFTVRMYIYKRIYILYKTKA